MKLSAATLTLPAQAPALARGLELLRFLEDGAWHSLEDAARSLRLPKASAYRLLATLVQQGLAEKGPDKRYQARWVLRPRDAEQPWRERLEAALERLAESTGCTAEWYQPALEGMRLCRQIAGDAEVQVVARPGYLRDWSGELDAVACLGYAFAQEAPEPSDGLSAYLHNGRREALPAEQARRRIEEARAERHATDVAFNTNGIRRCALAVMDARDRFRGVLALAEAFRFDA
ncbi:MAG: helix-turn-helix domain-containing protein, partial [Verrucomicrobiota bacterium]